VSLGRYKSTSSDTCWRGLWDKGFNLSGCGGHTTVDRVSVKGTGAHPAIPAGVVMG